MHLPELDTFRSTRRGTLDLVQGLGQDELDRRPDQRTWSPGEVLDHLVRTDDLLQPDLFELVERRLRGDKPFLYRGFEHYDLRLPLVPRAFVPLVELPIAMLGLFVPTRLRSALTRPRAVPAKAPGLLRPRPARPRADLLGDLEGTLRRLEELVAAHPGLDFRRLTYYNPLIGYTHFPGILAFSANHEERHQDQLRDLLQAA